MVLEVADIKIVEGSEQEFADAFQSIRHVLEGTEGCHGAKLHRCIESPSRFVLLVQWEDVDAHEKNFRGTDRFVTWRGVINKFLAAPTYVEHFAEI
jgi:heme-degrading monooxygenase HmoA